MVYRKRGRKLSMLRRSSGGWQSAENSYSFCTRFLCGDFPRDAVENMSPIETDNELWNGEAKYSPTEFILHSPTVNCLFDEDDEEVVFVRQELDEEPAA